eukprot:IDg15243t1
MPGTKPTTVRKRAGSTVAIVAAPYEQDDPETEEMFYSNEYYVLTEELPSTDQGSGRTPMDQQYEERDYSLPKAIDQNRYGGTGSLICNIRSESLSWSSNGSVPQSATRDNGTNPPSTRMGSRPSQSPWQRRHSVKKMNTRQRIDRSPRQRPRTVCYRCYGIGHISPACIVDPRHQAMAVLSNWTEITR